MTESHDDQPRQPRGVPSGGQFTAREYPEAPVSLSTDGSFYYPPVFRDGAHVAEFFKAVDIPDEACRRAIQVYRDKFDWVVENHPEQSKDLFRATYRRNNPAPDAEADPKAHTEWERQMNLFAFEQAKAYKEQLRARDRYLRPQDVRNILRATAIRCWLTSCNGGKPDEYDVYRAEQTMFELQGGARNVTQIVTTYCLHLFPTLVLDDPGAREPLESPTASVSAASAGLTEETVRQILREETAALSPEAVRQIVREESERASYGMGNQLDERVQESINGVLGYIEKGARYAAGDDKKLKPPKRP